MGRMSILFNPRRLTAAFLARYCNWLPEDTFLKWRYRLLMNAPLNLDNPKTFTEKIQWLKLYDRKPIYKMMVDKALAKDFVAERIGKEYVIPTYGVWDKFDDIDFSKLPNQFILKSTNGGGGTGVAICQDKSSFDFGRAKSQLGKSMRDGTRNLQGEWVYEGLKPKIIAEELLRDVEDGDLKDYKFFCFNGKVKYLAVHAGRFSEHFSNYYDSEWNLQNWGFDCPIQLSHVFQCPANFEEMKSIAEKLSFGHKFLRVDLYNVEGKIYFGELTFYPDSGFGKFTPKEWDRKLGDLIHLEETGSM